MRHFALILALLVTWTTRLSAEDRPTFPASVAKEHDKTFATVFGRVVEVRRIFKGPIIFEIEGKPTAPTFRALVYPLAVERFGSDPEKVYLGQIVEVTGPITIRKDLPQIWINDPTAIRLKKTNP